MAKDKYQDIVKEALIAEGWTITHEPYPLKGWNPDWDIHLGAEKNDTRIAVEVKPFTTPSFSNDFHEFTGQCLCYTTGLEALDKERILYFVVPLDVWNGGFQLKSIQFSIEAMKANIIVFNVESKKIEEWISHN